MATLVSLPTTEDPILQEPSRVLLHQCLQYLFFPVLFLFDWVGVLWPQLSKVLKVVCWAGSAPFPPVSLQRQVVPHPTPLQNLVLQAGLEVEESHTNQETV